jgi:DNA-binding IclR family transcriptional regulator
VRIVVSHLRFKETLPETVIESAREVTERIVEAGGNSASLVRVDDDHAILVLAFPDPETEERIKSEIGGPWMNEHVLPLLASPTERSSGEVVASAN